MSDETAGFRRKRPATSRWGRWESPISFYHKPRACQRRDTVVQMSALSASNHQRVIESHLLIKLLNPPIQILNLILTQIITVIQRPVQVLGQHFFVKRLTSQSPRRISACKILI